MALNFRRRFNSQPPEGGWEDTQYQYIIAEVSTHSRPKAAGFELVLLFVSIGVSTHSRPKAAGPGIPTVTYSELVSTHSRPKAAGNRP